MRCIIRAIKIINSVVTKVAIINYTIMILWLITTYLFRISCLFIIIAR